MLTNQKLNALVLEVVVHDALVVASDSNSPLLQLSEEALTTLLRHSGDVALSSCVLEGEMVSILDPHLLQKFKSWARRTTLEDTCCRALLLVRVCSILGAARLPSILVIGLDKSDHIFNRLHANLSLSHVCAIKAVYAVGTKDTSLKLDHIFTAKSFTHKEAKFILHGFD